MLDINHTQLTDAIKQHASEIATILLKKPMLGDVKIAPEEGEIQKLAEELGFEVIYYAGSNDYEIVESKTHKRIAGFLSAEEVLVELKKIKQTQSIIDDVHLSNEIQTLAFSLGLKVWHHRDGDNYTAYPERGPDAFIRFTLGSVQMLDKLKQMKTELDPKKNAEDERSMIWDLSSSLGLNVRTKEEGKIWEAWEETSHHSEQNRILVAESAQEMIDKLKSLIMEAESN